jgi:hypothetical protein
LHGTFGHSRVVNEEGLETLGRGGFAFKREIGVDGLRVEWF